MSYLLLMVSLSIRLFGFVFLILLRMRSLFVNAKGLGNLEVRLRARIGGI